MKAVSILALLVTGYAVSLFLGGFATPVRGVWPPHRDEARFKVVVFADALHSEIGLWSEDDPEARHLDDLVSWSYGEKKYYLEGKTGLWGKLRATLIPTKGVVRVHRAGWRFRDDRHLPEKIWTFYLSRTGYDRLRRHLRGELASAMPISRTEFSEWYAARRSYHACHNCHHWTAHALRQAGLPIWSSHAACRWTLERQLNRAQSMAAPGS